MKWIEQYLYIKEVQIMVEEDQLVEQFYDRTTRTLSLDHSFQKLDLLLDVGIYL